MLGQHLGDPAVVDVEQFGEVAVGEEPPLLVGLLAQAPDVPQQALASGKAVDAPLHVFGRGEVEKHGDQFGVDDPLPVGGRVLDADGHPERLAV